jgi:WD40 repeat protein
MKWRYRIGRLAWLAGWGTCLVMAACHATMPTNSEVVKTARSAAPTSIVTLSATRIEQSATITPTATSAPSPAIISPEDLPQETRQPTAQVITRTNLSRLKIIARRDYAPNELITALAWSPDGARLAVAAGEQIRWLDGASFQDICLLSIGAFSRSLAFSTDGLWLAAGSQDGFVRLWQTHSLDQPSGSHEPVFSLQAHKKGVNQVVFDPIRPLFATGGNDAVARVWDLTSAGQVNQIIGGTYAVPGLAFSPDGEYLAVMNGSVIRLRDALSGRMAAALRVDTNLFSLAFSPSGDKLAAGDNASSVWLWSQDSFQAAGSLPSQPQRLNTGVAGSGQKGLVWQVSFSPGGELLGAALADGSLQFWDAQSGEKLGSLQLGDSATTSLAFHPDGGWLVAGGLNASLQLWGIAP